MAKLSQARLLWGKKPWLTPLRFVQQRKPGQAGYTAMSASPKARARPSPWVLHHAHRIQPRGQVLDLAAGDGRHTRWLQQQGHPVLAADINLTGLQDLAGQPGIDLLQTDLEARDWPFTGQHFAGIVVTNYLYRPHLAKLADNLDSAGILIYETFAVGQEQYGKPANPEFLLRPGELLEVFAGCLQVIAFEQGMVSEGQPKILQRLCAVKNA